jgi:hypothetical protein
MTEETIFADQQSGQEPSPEGTEKQEGNTVDGMLSSIKNQDGNQKYKTVEDALSGLANSQEHIAKIEKENAEYREQLTKAMAMEDLLSELKQKPEGGETPTHAGIKPEEIKGMTLQAIQEYEAQKTEEANAASVDAQMRERYGDKAKEVFIAKAEELEVGLEFLYGLAKKSPAGFMAQFKETHSGTPSIKPSVNTSAMSENQTEPLKAPDNIGYGSSHKEVVDYWNQVKKEVEREFLT